SAGTRTVTQGPFEGRNELPAGFTILRALSLDEAIEWASRQAKVLGDVEIDIRPVTEAWDIGMAPRPEGLTTRRYMALRKATSASEKGEPLTPGQQAEMARLIDETTRAGTHLVTEAMRPSARGRRYKNSREGVRFTDGPFAESKELIAGYVIVAADSLEDAGRWATRYIEAVEAEEVDLLEMEDAPIVGS
ncbi:MAG TPA: YciI family protein, partial [Vicinamibacteria bacterium]